jgi:hypothetical protein
MSLKGSKKAKEPLQEKGSLVGAFNRICNFLYILDMKGLLRGIGKERMHK